MKLNENMNKTSSEVFVSKTARNVNLCQFGTIWDEEEMLEATKIQFTKECWEMVSQKLNNRNSIRQNYFYICCGQLQ